MLQGVVTGLGAVPGILPTSATLLHACGKSKLGPGAQVVLRRAEGEGELRGHHYCQCINGNIPWHGDSAWQGRGVGQHTWGRLAPQENHQLMHQGYQSQHSSLNPQP